MNVLQLPLDLKRGATFLALILGSCLALLIPGRADPAASDASAQEARAAAAHWLAEIDGGNYEQSYAEGCTAFHNKVSRDEWITVLKALRPNIGALVSRKEASASYKPDGFEGLDGECMVFTYNTTFSKLGPTLEVVVLKREDGTWRGAGYNAQPQQADSTGQ